VLHWSLKSCNDFGGSRRCFLVDVATADGSSRKWKSRRRWGLGWGYGCATFLSTSLALLSVTTATVVW